MSKIRYLVDQDGEVLNTLNEFDRIVRHGQSEFISETTKINFNFVKINVDALANIENSKYVSKILQFIEFGTGILKYKNGRVIKKNIDLGRKMSDNEKVGYRIVKQLMKEDVIHRHITSDMGVYFTFNPFIAHSGKRVPKELYNEFYSSKWRSYCDKE